MPSEETRNGRQKVEKRTQREEGEVDRGRAVFIVVEKVARFIPTCVP